MNYCFVLLYDDDDDEAEKDDDVDIEDAKEK